MKTYVGRRVVEAIPFTYDEWQRELNEPPVSIVLGEQNIPGYKIKHENGTYGWLHKENFEKEFHEMGSEPLTVYSIPNQLLSSVASDSLMKTISTPQTSVENDKGLYPCYYGETIHGIVTTEIIKEFIGHLNKYMNEGIIDTYGCIAAPFMLPLAILSPVRRTILAFYGFSKYQLDELKTMNPSFVGEGELPKEKEGYNKSNMPLNMFSFKEGQIVQLVTEVTENVVSELKTMNDKRQYLVMGNNGCVETIDITVSPEDSAGDIYKKIDDSVSFSIGKVTRL